MECNIFITNKYTRVYNKIIKKASDRNTCPTYTETHHIYPRCLGGTDSDSNLIVLTPREHYICHALLPKMVKGQAKYKMYAAFNMMHVGHDGKRYTSQLYEQYKTKFYKLHSERQKGKKRSLESRKKQSEKTKGIPWSDKAKSVKRKKPTAKAVNVYNKTDNSFVGEWESIALCARELNCDCSAIWRILTERKSIAPDGKSRPCKSHKGYTFQYKD